MIWCVSSNLDSVFAFLFYKKAFSIVKKCADFIKQGSGSKQCTHIHLGYHGEKIAKNSKFPLLFTLRTVQYYREILSNGSGLFLIMRNNKNYLRVYRKQTDITQSDIGFLLKQPDSIKICRYEQGERKPPMDMILLYHILFNVPVDSLFEIQKDNLNEDLIVRVETLINDLKKKEQSQRVRNRIAFLTATLNRLTQ